MPAVGLPSAGNAARLTGCRYGELTRLRARDYNADVGTLQIVTSKSRRPRHVVLTEDESGRAAAGRPASEVILTRDDGRAWGRSEQHRRITDACSAANVAACAFHELRHTYASRLVMRGVPLAVVAAQLGHKDTRMVEKHYGHLAPNYVADTVRAAFGPLGIFEGDSLVPLASAGKLCANLPVYPGGADPPSDSNNLRRAAVTIT